jgi:predicted Zn-dependent peptidase
MTRLGKGELLFGDVLSVDQLLARIDAVTPDDVRAVAATVAGAPMSLAVVGPFADHDFSGAVEP